MKNTNGEFNENTTDEKVESERRKRLEREIRTVLKNASFLEVRFVKDAINQGKIQIDDILDMVNVEQKLKLKEWTKGFGAGFGSTVGGLALGALIVKIMNR